MEKACQQLCAIGHQTDFHSKVRFVVGTGAELVSAPELPNKAGLQTGDIVVLSQEVLLRSVILLHC